MASGNSSTNASWCALLCPNLTEQPTNPTIWTLEGLYLVIVVWSIVLLYREYSLGLSSFRHYYMWLELILGVSRMILFAVEPVKNKFLLYFVFYFWPVLLQFLLVTTVLLFLFKCWLFLDRHRAYLFRTAVVPTYFVINTAALAGAIVDSFFSSKSLDSSSTPDENRDNDAPERHYAMTTISYAAINFSCLTLIMFVVAIFVYTKLRRLVVSESRQKQFKANLHLILLYVLVFTCRCAWDISQWVGETYMQTKLISIARDSDNIIYLAIYLPLEIIPAFVFLVAVTKFARQAKNRVELDLGRGNYMEIS
eukprot:m.699777 g.699777  ORF g.699777 m.699777 type:complete len:309 (-) comp58693_c0_seq6:114-1040(-)